MNIIECKRCPHYLNNYPDGIACGIWKNVISFRKVVEGSWGLSVVKECPKNESIQRYLA